MAITTYATLQTAIADWAERADLTARIPDFITLAEAQMNRELRVRRMIERATASITDPYSVAPIDFLEIVSMVLTDGVEPLQLSPAPPETLDGYSTAQATGQPRFWSVVGEEIRYYPNPDRPYTATLTYYAKIPALSNANTTNWVLQTHPDAYLFGALKEAGPFLKDADVTAAFEAKYQAAIQSIKAAERTRTGPLRLDEFTTLQDRRTFNIITDTP